MEGGLCYGGTTNVLIPAVIYKHRPLACVTFQPNKSFQRLLTVHARLFRHPFSLLSICWDESKWRPRENIRKVRVQCGTWPYLPYDTLTHPQHIVDTTLSVRPDIQSEDQNQFFTFKVRTFWQTEVKISVLALWLVHCPHSSIIWWGGMDVILSLYVPGMFRGVWKNVLTLNALYTDLSSLWMLGQTHYTHVCIVCPHFECRGW